MLASLLLLVDRDRVALPRLGDLKRRADCKASFSFPPSFSTTTFILFSSAMMLFSLSHPRLILVNGVGEIRGQELENERKG